MEAPTPSNAISLSPLGTFAGDTAEIVAYDSATQRLFVTNAETASIDIIDVSDPTAPVGVGSIDGSIFPAPGPGEAVFNGFNSISIKNGVIAAAAEFVDPTDSDIQRPGFVVLFDADGNLLDQIQVGALPDMLTFTPDGTQILVANEGEPGGGTDPEGSISIINLTGSETTTVVVTNDFEDGTNQGWGVGGGTPPSNIASNGPNGADDNFLQFESSGGGGPNSRLVVFNNDAEWTGDFLAAGVTEVSFAANNLGATDINLRFAIQGTDGTWYSTTEAIPLAPGSGWQSTSLSLAPSNLTRVSGSGEVNDVLGSVASFRVLSSEEPAFQGDQVSATLGIDNVTLLASETGAIVTTADFSAFDGREEELRAKGVRIFPGNTTSLDVEPEFIAVSPDGSQAFVTLQEANAFAVVDIASGEVVDILPLGVKDHSQGQPALTQFVWEAGDRPVLGTTLGGQDILLGGFSGLFYIGETPDGKQEFVTLPDRGPNGEPTDVNGDGDDERPFALPDYQAQIIRFTLDETTGVFEILETTLLVQGDGTTPITGLPNIEGVDEEPVDLNGNLLPYDPLGADMEGIVIDPATGDFWTVDEYRPAIYQFSSEGVLINRFVPEGTAALDADPGNDGDAPYGTETLPADYSTRRANRGFEAVALDTEANILYAFIQTPLANPNRAASDTSDSIRILGIDPTTGTPVAEYIYLLEDPEARPGGRVDKIGDAVFDPETGHFFVLERDAEVSSDAKKFLFEVDFSGATNVLGFDFGGQTLEQQTPDSLAALGIEPVNKIKVANVPSLGYVAGDKPEGLALLDDGRLAVLNDNDFGLDDVEIPVDGTVVFQPEGEEVPVSLGLIEFTEGNTLDASDEDGAINLQNWPVFGLFMPDAIAAYEAADGQTYYITANEGDDRGEDERVGNLLLDPFAFPNPTDLQREENLGRLNVSTIDGISPNTILESELTPDQEVPPTTSTATGSSVLALNTTGDALAYSLTLAGFDFGALLGTAPQTPDPNDDLTRLHIHNAARGANGGVVFNLFEVTDPAANQDADDLTIVTNSDGSVTLSGVWEETDASSAPLSTFVDEIRNAAAGADVNLYWNAHSTEFPGGEIRGQLTGADQPAYNQLFAYGARSFTIWDDFGNLVFDSGDALELITAEQAPELFNANDGDPAEFDSRSDNKGPEPESVTIGVVGDRTYAFVGLERAGGGVVVYDVSEPGAPEFVQYVRNDGDISPEGLTFIAAEDSPTGEPLLAIANEVSGTTTLFAITEGAVVEVPEVFINEIRIDQPGDDNDEYIELSGEANTALDGLTYLVIGDGDGGSGVIETAIDLTGQTLDSEGLLLIAEPTFTLGTADFTTDLNFENGDNVTHLVVSNFTGAVGDDLDTNDDGVLDLEPFSVVDGVALIEEANPPAGTEFEYGTDLGLPVVGPDDVFVPGHVFRLPSGTGEFQIGAFDPVGGDDTPGAINAVVVVTNFDLQVTEIWPGNEPGANLTEDWFEITNFGTEAWVSGVDPDLFFDDDSQDPASGVVLQGITQIAPGESVVLVNGGATGATEFITLWGAALDLSSTQVGNYDGAGLGQGGDGVTLFVGGPAVDTLADFEDYPDANSFGGQSYDVVLDAFSIAGVSGAVATAVNDAGQPAVGTPGFLPSDAPALTPIYDIQGAAHTSPLNGQAVDTQGIVTAVDSNGFYLQDAVGDGDDATSDGIFVFTSSAPGVAVGDDVLVSGSVSEFIPGGAATGNLSITQISSPTAVTVVSSGNALPAAVILGEGGRIPPNQVIDNDNFDPFDPTEDGLDFFESLEGMRVTAQNTLAVSNTNGFDEIYVVVDGGASATGLSDRGTINISPDDFNPERVQIDEDTGILDFAFPDVNVGAELGDVTGVISYSFGNYEVLVTEDFTANGVPSTLTPETTSFDSTASTQLLVATYNVLNLDPKAEDPALADQTDGNPTDDTDDDVANGRFEAIAQQIIDNLATPDIIALQEIQDNDGTEITDVSAADETLQALVDAIAAAGGPVYEFIDTPDVQPDFIDDNGTPDDTSDDFLVSQSGGAPGGNIRVAYLYNPERVALVADSVQRLDDPDLSDGNAFEEARTPLAASFLFNGQEITLVNNHFTSKGGSSPLFGQTQPSVDLQEDPAVNAGLEQRQAQAEVVKGFVDDILGADPTANVVVLGDLNEFEFISPVLTLAESLTNLTEDLPEDERYTFIFDGNSQSLDHILVSEELSDLAQVDIVHVNTEFADTPQRASDHDPILVQLTLAGDVVVEDSALIFGSPDADRLEANLTPGFDGSNDVIFTGAGDDLVDLTASSTDSIIIAGSDNDELFASERDRLFGDAGDDILEGSVGSGSNRLYGGDGDDELIAGAGDRLFGGPGNDTFFLNALDSEGGDNRAYGQSGDDTFFLGTGDRVIGDEGDDSFFATSFGDNTLTGGAGADAFWIINVELPSSANTITDFEIGVDVLSISFTGVIDDVSDLTLNQVGSDTVISAPNPLPGGVVFQDVAILLGTSATALADPGNFLIA